MDIVSHLRELRGRAGIAAVGAGLALVLSGVSGCASQLDALAPVGGDDLSMVRTAATTILLANNLEILDAPQCEKSETDITCVGSLFDGSEVLIEAPLEPFGSMTVTVGGSVLFEGDLKKVIEAQAEGELP